MSLWNDPSRTGTGGNPSPSSMQAYTRTYEYDKMGNILQLKQTAGNTFTRNFHYDTISSDNLLHSIKKADNTTNFSTFTYDSNGNKLTAGTTRKYIWDYSDQLKAYLNQAGTSEPSVYAQYLYSGGQRVKKLVRTGGGGTETTVYIDGIFEHKYDGTNSQSIVRVGGVATVRTGYAFDGLSGTSYELSNHLGSVSIRLDSNGSIIDREEYYPFGDSSVRTWDKKRYRYVGKEKDAESGLYYYGARYYSAWTCRFISVDPLARDYPQLTSYNYASNAPINSLDVDGMQNPKEIKSGDKITASSANLDGNKYTVGPGHTLFSISKLTGVSVNDIMKENKLNSPNIKKGQVLTIPGQTSENQANTQEDVITNQNDKTERKEGRHDYTTSEADLAKLISYKNPVTGIIEETRVENTFFGYWVRNYSFERTEKIGPRTPPISGKYNAAVYTTKDSKATNIDMSNVIVPVPATNGYNSVNWNELSIEQKVAIFDRLLVGGYLKEWMLITNEYENRIEKHEEYLKSGMVIENGFILNPRVYVFGKFMGYLPLFGNDQTEARKTFQSLTLKKKLEYELYNETSQLKMFNSKDYPSSFETEISTDAHSICINLKK